MSVLTERREGVIRISVQTVPWCWVSSRRNKKEKEEEEPMRWEEEKAPHGSWLSCEVIRCTSPVAKILV